MQAKEIRTDITGCARCDGKGHRGLVFKPFKFPAKCEHDDATVFTHWATCPTVYEPILLYFPDLPENRE
jgi:hypothetical protein